MSQKSYETKSSDKSDRYSQIKLSEQDQYYQTSKYTQRHNDNSAEHKPHNHSYKYPTKREDKIYPLQQKYIYDEPYTQRQKFNYDNPRQDDKSYYQQQKNDNTTKQTQQRNIYKYKIERDESGNCSYVLEEPEYNLFNLINNSEIVCVYPNNGTKYYKNINIYNYKTYKRYNKK